MLQWGVNHYENYDTYVNMISVRSILAIASIHGFPRIPIDFLLNFQQANVDLYVFIDPPFGMGVDGNR